MPKGDIFALIDPIIIFDIVIIIISKYDLLVSADF